MEIVTSVTRFLEDIDVLLSLRPELLITGHDEPIRGEDHIAVELGRIRDAVRYIHDETVKGMNEHRDLWQLMREIKLPPDLATVPGRGPVSWYVRAVWEQYTGWVPRRIDDGALSDSRAFYLVRTGWARWGPRHTDAGRSVPSCRRQTHSGAVFPGDRTGSLAL